MSFLHYKGKMFAPDLLLSHILRFTVCPLSPPNQHEAPPANTLALKASFYRRRTAVA
jgi:hypothetical protein